MQDSKLRTTLWLSGALLVLTPLNARPQVAATDVALRVNFQDSVLGHFKRGRALIAADFDLDGWTDFFLGNPADESLILRSVPDGGGARRYEVVQIISENGFAWGAASADYDNDGDFDLFISMGGNEQSGFDRLFRNEWIETGKLVFTDVTIAAGIAGPLDDQGGGPYSMSSANAVWGDIDQDGLVDLFVNIRLLSGPEELTGKNLLWRNQGDGTFEDISDTSGLGATRRWTQHSTLFDFDNDGDLDLYECNAPGLNVLWRNEGNSTFSDVTARMSLPGEDISLPRSSFASTVTDINNDGWQDLVIFSRFPDEPAEPYGPGHAIFLNEKGTGFRNVVGEIGINQAFISERGAMGCQVGDLNADGFPDLYIGTGAPEAGQTNQLFISRPPVNGGLPRYRDVSGLIDVPAPEDPDAPPGFYPPYPYRTHGSVMVDINGDGSLELAISNGGPAADPDEVREPNRLFDFAWPINFSHLKLRPVGDGVQVSRDAIGTRFGVTVRRSAGGDPWTVWQTLLAGSCFSAQSGFEVYFGLRNADLIDSVRVIWPDGVEETITEGLNINSTLVVERGAGRSVAEPGSGTRGGQFRGELRE